MQRFQAAKTNNGFQDGMIMHDTVKYTKTFP